MRNKTPNPDGQLNVLKKNIEKFGFVDKLDAVTRFLNTIYGARLMFVKTNGCSWSYDTGKALEKNPTNGPTRICLDDNIGLVIENWGDFNSDNRLKSIEFFKHIIEIEKKKIEPISKKNHNIINLINVESEELFSVSDAVRKKLCGDEVHIISLIEYSNICSRNCFYCGLRQKNKDMPRYVMTSEEIISLVSKADGYGIKNILLQSGENDEEPADFLAETITRIKKDFDVAVTLSVGAKPVEYYETWRRAGADRYLLKHETANPALYKEVHPDSTLENRLNAIRTLKKLGYEVGTGALVGLPGQTTHDLAADIQLAENLDGDMELAFKILAAARIVLGPVHIPAITAFEAIGPEGREKALCTGANAITVNITPEFCGRFWDVYPRNYSVNSVRKVTEMLERIGRPPATGKGR